MFDYKVRTANYKLLREKLQKRKPQTANYLPISLLFGFLDWLQFENKDNISGNGRIVETAERKFETTDCKKTIEENELLIIEENPKSLKVKTIKQFQMNLLR